jgi:hypothetical protein
MKGLWYNVVFMDHMILEIDGIEATVRRKPPFLLNLTGPFLKTIRRQQQFII